MIDPRLKEVVIRVIRGASPQGSIPHYSSSEEEDELEYEGNENVYVAWYVLAL